MSANDCLRPRCEKIQATGCIPNTFLAEFDFIRRVKELGFAPKEIKESSPFPVLALTLNHDVQANGRFSGVRNIAKHLDRQCQEEFPRFMESVEEVRQDGPKRLFWKAKIAGKDKQWEAEIAEQVPDEKIAWASVDGTPNTGEVTFEFMESERTLITLTMEYEPEGILEMAGDALGIPSDQVEEDLKRFRDFIEQTGRETGGWRGRIGEGPDSTAGAVRQEGAQSVESAPDEAGIETDRIRAEQDKSFQTGEQPSGLANEPKPFVGERLSEPWETAPHKGEIEIPGIQSERGSHDLADESARGAADRLGERGKQQIGFSKADVIRPTDEQIARRAYELYLDRGQTPGHELEDWLQAQRELSENGGKRQESVVGNSTILF
jgi:hypothetical protein